MKLFVTSKRLVFPFKLCRTFCTAETESIRVRVRFAPSPTGYLHLGGMRTALLNYLFAKANEGKFILRIEDTDRKRFVPGAWETMEASLRWMGVVPDEGPESGGDFGPYFQTERLNIYQQGVEKLLDKPPKKAPSGKSRPGGLSRPGAHLRKYGSDSAYRCFCSEDRLMLMRKEQLRNRETVKYDGKCRNLKESEISQKLASGKPFVVRFRNQPDLTKFQDMIFGEVEHDLYRHEGDPILLKSDKYPTYHLANVVDDHHMQISHVLRGEEWLMSTVKHLQLYRALGWKPPKFGHFPLLTNKKGAKLSKRHGDIFVEDYREAGYFPLALLNFLTRMGGGFRGRDEHTVYDMESLIEKLHINSLGRNRLKVDFSFLDIYNRKILDSTSTEELVEVVRNLVLEKFGNSVKNLPREVNILDTEFLKKAISYSLPRISTLKGIFDDSLMFFWTIPTNRNALTTFYPPEKVMNILGELRQEIKRIGKDSTFVKSELGPMFRNFAVKRELEFTNFMGFVRYTLSGVTVGPPVAEMFELLGEDVSVSRLDYLLELLKSNKNGQ